MKFVFGLLFLSLSISGSSQVTEEPGVDISASAEVMTGDSADELAIYLKDVDPITVRNEDDLVIWPVPAREELHIHCKSAQPGNLPFEIVNLTGKVILRGSIVSGQVNMIEFTAPAKGDHLLRVVDGRSVRSIAFQRIE
jgi:hypothetical protein